MRTQAQLIAAGFNFTPVETDLVRITREKPFYYYRPAYIRTPEQLIEACEQSIHGGVNELLTPAYVLDNIGAYVFVEPEDYEAMKVQAKIYHELQTQIISLQTTAGRVRAFNNTIFTRVDKC